MKIMTFIQNSSSRWKYTERKTSPHKNHIKDVLILINKIIDCLCCQIIDKKWKKKTHQLLKFYCINIIWYFP